MSYLGYRSCIACTRAKAEARALDPATYTGKCPKGHEYTRENTLIVLTHNQKMCLTCKRGYGTTTPGRFRIAAENS